MEKSNLGGKPANDRGETEPQKEEMLMQKSTLKESAEELPSDIAVEVKLRKETAKTYKRKIEVFLEELLKDEKVLKVQFIILNDDKEAAAEEEESKSYFFNECATPVQNGDVSLQQLPFYDQSFDEPLGYVQQLQGKNKNQGLRCFNCLGSHHLKECPEAHNGSRIANNKRDLMDAPTVRYHTDDAQPFENSILRPGYISDQLREALSLQPNQLPIYIYNMRILGYPPGWMREAEIESSGLTVYDSNGNAIGKEDSEVSKKKCYDGKKFIAFPGFNTPVPDGMIDECEKLQMPPLLIHQQLSEALKHKLVTVSSEYKKRKKNHDLRNDSKKDRNGCEDATPKAPARDSSNNRQKDNPAHSRKRANTNVVLSGSPLINTGNPYKKVPDSNKFAEGMSDYLPYENLPDAVGAFDKKMRGVLDDVREKMTKQQ